MTNADRIAQYRRRLDEYMESGGDLYPRPLTPFTKTTYKEHIQCLATPFLAPTPEISPRSTMNRSVNRILHRIVFGKKPSTR